MGRVKLTHASIFLATALLLAHSCGFAEETSQEFSDISSQKLEIEILLGAARNSVHLGDTQTAIQRFERLYREFPDQEEGRAEYAGILFQAGHVKEAKREYELLLKKKPGNLELTRSLVDILFSMGDYPRVRELLEPIVQQNPDRIDFALDLAKVYAEDGDLKAAQEIIKTRIIGRPLDSDTLRIKAVELFIQMRQPTLAAKPLGELLRNHPDDARVLAAEIRYEILVGNFKSAMEKAAKLDRLYPKKIGLQLELASALYSAEYYTEAGDIFDNILKTAPQNHVALLGSARIALRYNKLQRASELLNKVPESAHERSWQLVMAEYSIIAGNYRRAQEVLQALIRKNPKDRDAILALADLNRAEHEFVKADCRYETLGARNDNRTASLHLAKSLAIQKRFCAAEAICRTVVQEAPKEPEANLLLGTLLAECKRFAEAIPYLEKASKLKKEPLPEYVFYTHILEGNSCDFDWDPLSTAKRPLYSAAVIYSLSMQEGRRRLARQILDAGLQRSPDNIVLRTHLAEWYASFGTISYATEAVRQYDELLDTDPDNQKWLLGLARANATRRCYDQSLATYARLRREQPNNYLVAREQARVVTSVDGTLEGQTYYDQAICNWLGLSEEKRRLSLERNAKLNHVPRPTAAAVDYRSLIAMEPYDPHLRFELGQVYGAVGDTQCAINTYSNLLFVAPNHRDAKVALEGKWLDLQNQIFSDYEFQRERGRNGLTSIDRGRILTGVRRIYDNEDEFLSLAYGRLTLAPTLGDGTPGNALDLLYQRRLPSNFSNWISPCSTPYFFIDGGIEGYDRLVSTRPVGRIGFKMRTANDVVWILAGNLENILENHESLRQDLYRGGVFVGAAWLPASYWETELNYSYDAYSDDNNRHAAAMRNRVKLTPDPKRLSLLINLDYWNFAQPSVFSPGPDPFANMIHPYFSPQNFLQTDVGIEYKRWLGRGPQHGFGYDLPCRLVAPGLSRQCSRSHYGDRFNGADYCWISFSARKRWDSQDKNYTIFNGTMAWDITRRLTSYAKAEYLESSVYQATGAYAGLSWIY